MVTPGGYRMSVAMTNCGGAGWVTDRKRLPLRPQRPQTGAALAGDPGVFRALAARAAAAGGFPGFAPDACLINRYEPGSRLSLHQDRNERDFARRSSRCRSGCRRCSCSAGSRVATVRAASASRAATSSCGAGRRGSPSTASTPWPKATTPYRPLPHQPDPAPRALTVIVRCTCKNLRFFSGLTK